MKNAKKMLTLFILLLPGAARADSSIREFFRETEDKVLDFAFFSSIEAGYARDMLNGVNLVVGQSPMIYLTPYISGDFGYVTGYDDKTRGSLMFGGSLRVNRLIEDAFTDKVMLVRSHVPEVDKHWNKLWIGPFVAKRFSDVEGGSLQAGIKAGLRW